MKSKRSLIAILLGVGLCFVPALGYGEVYVPTDQRQMRIDLLEAKVNYIMSNPALFIDVDFSYFAYSLFDPLELPESVDTAGKIVIQVRDTRDVFSWEPDIALLEAFKRQLEAIYSFIKHRASNMDTDIVALFYSKGDIPLGYFYQGDYHLWSGQKQDVSESSRYGERTYSGLGGGHWIVEKIERGRQIKLEDGSLWKISVRHRLRTILWQVSQKITVAENDDLLYPYRLINQNTGDTVEAELVSE